MLYAIFYSAITRPSTKLGVQKQKCKERSQGGRQMIEICDLASCFWSTFHVGTVTNSKSFRYKHLLPNGPSCSILLAYYLQFLDRGCISIRNIRLKVKSKKISIHIEANLIKIFSFFAFLKEKSYVVLRSYIFCSILYFTHTIDLTLPEF